MARRSAETSIDSKRRSNWQRQSRQSRDLFEVNCGCLEGWIGAEGRSSHDRRRSIDQRTQQRSTVNEFSLPKNSGGRRFAARRAYLRNQVSLTSKG